MVSSADDVVAGTFASAASVGAKSLLSTSCETFLGARVPGVTANGKHVGALALWRIDHMYGSRATGRLWGWLVNENIGAQVWPTPSESAVKRP
jgi:hypothetical protein